MVRYIGPVSLTDALMISTIVVFVRYPTKLTAREYLPVLSPVSLNSPLELVTVPEIKSIPGDE